MSNDQEHVKHLQRLQADLYSQMPLIGGWLRREAAQTLIESGSPDAITTVGEAFFPQQ
jgi:hypothetical protein